MYRSLRLAPIILYAIVAVLVLWQPLQLKPDSIGYIESWFNRSPIYPILISILNFIFDAHYLTALKVLQLALGLFSIHFFVSKIKKLTSLQSRWSFLLTVVLLIPYIYNHRIANFMITEALAYPLYLIISVKVLEFLKSRNFRQFWQILGLMLVLLLIRKQFLFILPVLISILLWTGYQTKNFRKIIVGIIAVLLVPIFATQLDCIYHKVKHGHYVSTPWNGIHLLAPAMYVANPEDAEIFQDEEEKQFFKDMYAIIDEQQLTLASKLAIKKNPSIQHYLSSFSTIANTTLYSEGIVRFEAKLPANEALIALNEMTIDMALPLVLHNFQKWLKVYVNNAMNGFGSAKYFLVFIILACTGLFYVRRKTIVIYTIGLFSLFAIANVALISIGMHTLKRFVFYNDWVLYLILFLLLQQYFESTKKLESED